MPGIHKHAYSSITMEKSVELQIVPPDGKKLCQQTDSSGTVVWDCPAHVCWVSPKVVQETDVASVRAPVVPSLRVSTNVRGCVSCSVGRDLAPQGPIDGGRTTSLERLQLCEQNV